MLDHQWAGLSDGEPGLLDRGYGVARDVAAVAASARQLAQELYPDKQPEVVFLGNSMGAGRLKLDGAPMPSGPKALLLAPYFAPAPTPLNEVLKFFSNVPLVNRLATPQMGVPPLSTEPQVNARLAAHTAIDQVAAAPQALSAPLEDMGRVLQLVAEGNVPSGRMVALVPEDDVLASPEAARQVMALLGERGAVHLVPTRDHVLEESAVWRERILGALDGLLAAH